MASGTTQRGADRASYHRRGSRAGRQRLRPLAAPRPNGNGLTQPSHSANAPVQFSDSRDAAPIMSTQQHPPEGKPQNLAPKIKMPGFDPYKYGHPMARKKDEESRTPGAEKVLSHGIPTEREVNHDADSPNSRDAHVVQTSLFADQLLEQPTRIQNAHKIPDLTKSRPGQSLELSPMTDALSGNSPGSSSMLKAPRQKHRMRVEDSQSRNNQLQAPLASSPRVQNGVSQDSKANKVSKESEPALKKGQNESQEEFLKRLQLAHMQEINHRNRNKGAKGKSTTSLSDLALARKPLAGSPATVVSTPIQSIAERTGGDSLAISEDNGYLHLRPLQNPPKQTRGLQNSTFSESRTQILLPNWGSTPTRNQISEAVADTPPSLQVEKWADKQETAELFSSRKTRRHSQWCTTAELKPIPAKIETDSNAWGSEVPSNAQTESNDSIQPMHHGKLFRKKGHVAPEVPLQGWDGKFQPPPIDWDDRPQFNNNTPEFKNGFNNWTRAAAELVGNSENQDPFQQLPYEMLRDLDLQPDGISMVPKSFTLDITSAPRYGYYLEPVHLADATKYCQPLTDEDWADWGKLDLNEPGNLEIKNETTDGLVANWNAHKQQARVQAQAETEILQSQRAITGNANTEAQPENPDEAEWNISHWRPKANIYLRPCVRNDLRQLTDLYNWHVIHGPRTAEINPITESDMKDRYNSAMASKLPFIVACSRKIGKGYYDKIVGFAIAEDLTALDYVERISAELEIYVHPAYMHKGVGTCLMDKLLESTDRGHLPNKTWYPWYCDTSDLMLCTKYEAGGARDLHTLIFVLRQWKHPQVPEDGKIGKKSIGAWSRFGYGNTMWDDEKNDQYADMIKEDDFEKWTKPWLEKYDFEEQGCLKGVATKGGRFLNEIYMVRQTQWRPAEGRIPDYIPGLGAAEVSESD